MIWHKTVTDDICTRGKLLFHFLNKEHVIISIKKYGLLIITSIIDMIEFVFDKVHDLGSGRLKRPEP